MGCGFLSWAYGDITAGRKSRIQGRYSCIQQPCQSSPSYNRPEGSIYQPLFRSTGRHAVSRFPFSVIPSEKNAPDQSSLYLPSKKKNSWIRLLTILSIRPNALLGQDTVNNVRSFSRYEYYLLEQALEVTTTG